MMADPRWRLHAGDEGWGHICPVCAGPKTLQAAKCRACETDRLRAEIAARPPTVRAPRKRKSRAKQNPVVSAHDPTHPWRKAAAASIAASHRRRARSA